MFILKTDEIHSHSRAIHTRLRWHTLLIKFTSKQKRREVFQSKFKSISILSRSLEKIKLS